MSHPKCQNPIHEEHMHHVLLPTIFHRRACMYKYQPSLLLSLSFPINNVSRSPQEVVVNNSFAMDRMECDPELSLRLGRAQDLPLGNSTAEQQQKQITIFYNGQICVCDVTEMQAIAIISTAKRAVRMEEGDAHNKKKKNNTNNSIHQYKQRVFSQALPSSPQLLNSGLSMKRSLQRFLQKRKTRMTSISPYENRRQLLASNMSSFR